MTNHTRTLYIGVTGDLYRRVMQHKLAETFGFTAKYKLNKLVYYEETPEVLSALEREKQLKGWRRSRKVDLIERMNPHWFDLAGHIAVQTEERQITRPDPSLRSG
jgi:putative endonuclease